MMPLESVIETYVQTLDFRYTENGAVKWDVYRAAVGGWIVRLTDESIHAETLTEALAKAVDYVPLPRIPRPPTRYSVGLFEPYKSGNKWRVRYNGHDFGVQFSRKRDAVEWIPRFAGQAATSYGNWEKMYGLAVEQGTEGVDFRWEI